MCSSYLSQSKCDFCLWRSTPRDQKTLLNQRPYHTKRVMHRSLNSKQLRSGHPKKK